MAAEAKAHGELVQVVEDLAKEIRDTSKSMGEKQETLERMQVELMDQLSKQEKRSLFPEVSMELFDGTPKSFKKHIIEKRVDPSHPKSEMISELQRKSDELLIITAMAKAAKQNRMYNAPESIQETETYKEYMKMVESVVKAAGDADFNVAGSAAWIPTDLSGNLRDFITMELRVAGVFDEFTMPTSTFEWPYATGAPEAVYSAEQTDLANAFSPGVKADQMYGGTDPAAKNTFVARKVKAFSFMSREWREDTIRATMPWLMRQLPLAIARAWDGAIINGSETAIDPVAPYNGAAHKYRWFDGLRQYVIGEVGTWAGDGTDTHAHEFEGSMGGTWAIADLPYEMRKQRKKMDKYGLRLSELVYIVDINFYYHLMSLDNFQTLDKLGNKATLLTGQVGAFDSIPVIPSEFMHTVEAEDGTTATDNGTIQSTFTYESGSNLLVWTPGWIKGRLPGLSVEMDRMPFSDMYGVVLYERGDFGPLEPSGTGGATTVNYGYDVPVF